MARKLCLIVCDFPFGNSVRPAQVSIRYQQRKKENSKSKAITRQEKSKKVKREIQENRKKREKEKQKN